jgi:hypothetical protein
MHRSDVLSEMESGMRTRSLVFTTAVLLGASLVLGGGPVASATTSKSRVAGGTGKLKGSGAVHISAYSDNDGPTSFTVLTGAIGDYGKAIRTYAGGHVEQNYNRLDLAVSHGSFQLEIAGLEQSLVSGADQLPTDLNTCSGSFVVHATTPIVPGSGTDAYKGISGSFNLIVTVNEVDSWPKCPTTGQTLITQTVFVTGSGLVSFR